MLQELLEMCTDPSQSLPDNEKSTLLGTSLKAVLHLCNGTGVAREIAKHLTNFCESENEKASYAPFVRAANCALLELSKLKVPGITTFNAKDDSNILFHTNDLMPMFQNHQGEQSKRKADVVIVSQKCARDMSKKTPAEPPNNNFRWIDVRSTVEFKRTRKCLPLPPSKKYNTDYVVPKDLHMAYRKETDDPVEPTGSTSAAVPARTSHEASNESRQTSKRLGGKAAELTGSRPAVGPTQTAHGASHELRRTSERIKDKNEADKKRNSGHLDSNEPPAKRSRSNNEKTDEKEPKKHHPVVQNGLYAAEMFAAHIARLHVISSIVMNDVIYIWYFDRQDVIQCSGINFVQDLPRFMVLLLIMQRIKYKQWGLNTKFEPTPGVSDKIVIPDEKNGMDVDLKLDLTSDERTTHYGLRGRATTLFPVESQALSSLEQKPYFHNKSTGLVAKLYWPEESRESEPAILKKVYEIAKQEAEVVGHVPEMLWSYKFEETSTAKIRKALGLEDAERGSRVLYIIVFRELIPITTLSGMEFLSAWWQIALCHYALWRNGVRHRDASPSNFMVYQLGDLWIGVLNDYDLSSTQDDSPSGLERTGTVPFMALELLTKKAIAGQVEHLYQHDAESFIWVLAWVCLRYEEGKLLSKPRPLEQWLRVDVIGCHKEKTSFLSKLTGDDDDDRPSGSHQGNWKVVMKCLTVIYSHYGPGRSKRINDGEVFQLWLKAHVPEHLHGGVILPAK
ncbi:uncharacterized protein EDB91DRAFT_783481 [Suillus paluster]|uniref:uncharacterized protein n=1 Tax=Suillus paluster TaxID=48578 RepID=UPI001B87A0AF|nr:uncharacterized protein EDB91DRAFT_783481 [Suillus paluster]KAG1730541.1 hypothetical protein EDB91DRAFT_783481 [Suillus paluster]